MADNPQRYVCLWDQEAEEKSLCQQFRMRTNASEKYAIGVCVLGSPVIAQIV